MVQAKALKKGDRILIENAPMTVLSLEVSKIAKHGKQKARLEVLDNKKEKRVFIVLADQEFPPT